MLLSEIRLDASSTSLQLQTLRQELVPFITSRIKKPADSKAVKDVIRQLYHLFAIHDITVVEFLKDFNDDVIFDANVLLTGGNLFSNVNPKYRDFAEELYSVRSTGLGTPNAASGEGELMALLLSPEVSVSKRDKKGDLIVNGKYVELKGWAPRVFAKTLGTELNEFGIKLAGDFGIELGKATKGRHTVSPWDSGKREAFWQAQFAKIGKSKSIEFLHKLMNRTGATFSKHSIENCWNTNSFSAEMLQKEILKSFFEATPKDWDYLTVIVNGKVEAISNNTADFQHAVDNGTIIPAGNFFRMFKAIPVAWYYKFAIAPDTKIEIDNLD